MNVHKFDIRLPPFRSDSGRGELDAAARDDRKLWPGGIVPYIIDKTIGKDQVWYKTFSLFCVRKLWRGGIVPYIIDKTIGKDRVWYKTFTLFCVRKLLPGGIAPYIIGKDRVWYKTFSMFGVSITWIPHCKAFDSFLINGSIFFSWWSVNYSLNLKMLTREVNVGLTLQKNYPGLYFTGQTDHVHSSKPKGLFTHSSDYHCARDFIKLLRNFMHTLPVIPSFAHSRRQKSKAKGQWHLQA